MNINIGGDFQAKFKSLHNSLFSRTKLPQGAHGKESLSVVGVFLYQP